MVTRPTVDTVAGLNAIDGFSASELYAVGWSGEVWWRQDSRWHMAPPVTNLKLERVICVREWGLTIACGQAGLLLKGMQDSWDVIRHDLTKDAFWGMDTFAGAVWCSTANAVYRLMADFTLEPVKIADSRDFSCGWLATSGGLLWSVGPHHIYATEDGKKWRLEVIP
jgi:hypothetical protein